jgi:hypothetical protein
MTTPTKGTFRETADQLALLAGILQVPSREQRAYSIRRAEKALVALESVFTPEFVHGIKRWRESCSAIEVLESKLTEIDSFNQQIAACQHHIDQSRDAMTKWLAQPVEERSRFVHETRQARVFLESEVYKLESHVISHFERFQALKPLVPYADNADHLCESIYHFENRERYETNIAKLEQRKEAAKERIRSVKRGFILALVFSLFIVTIPLCVPFAFSLWARRREIESQISNTEETIRREERRLVSAEEGVVASETIRDILGNMPLEQIRRTLNEVRELRSEFQRPDRGGTVTSRILTFLDLNQAALTSLFGAPPSDFLDAVRWFVDHVTRAQNIERHLKEQSVELDRLQQRKRALTRGYSEDILTKTLENLTRVHETSFSVELPADLKQTLASVAMAMPNALMETRKALWYLTHAQPLSEALWARIQTTLRSLSSTLSACVALMELDLAWQKGAVDADSGESHKTNEHLDPELTPETHDTGTITTAAVG